MSLNDEYILKNAKKLEYGRIDTFVASYYHAMYELKAMNMAFSPHKEQPDSIKKMVNYFDEKMSELVF